MQGAKKELEAKSHMDLALHPLQAIAPTAPQGSTLNSAVRHTSARWKAGTEAHVEFPNDFDLLLSIRSLHLIRRIFAAVAGLRFRLSGCYPAKLLFGLLQLSAEALDEKIMLRSHIDLRGLNILMSWNECSIHGVTHITHSRGHADYANCWSLSGRILSRPWCVLPGLTKEQPHPSCFFSQLVARPSPRAEFLGLLRRPEPDSHEARCTACGCCSLGKIAPQLLITKGASDSIP